MADAGGSRSKVQAELQQAEAEGVEVKLGQGAARRSFEPHPQGLALELMVSLKTKPTH